MCFQTRALMPRETVFNLSLFSISRNNKMTMSLFPASNICLKSADYILYIIFTLALFITFTIKGEGGDGTLSFPPVCSPLIWLWNVMVIPLLQYVHIINYCTLGPQRRKKKSLYKIDRSTDTVKIQKQCV